MNVFIVSVQNLRDRQADENQPMWKMKYLLENKGILTEIITPFNDPVMDRRFKRFIWKFLYRLSRKKGLSFFYLFLLFIMARDIFHQVRISWSEFNSVFAFDSITACAAALASHNRIPVYLMSRYKDKPWKDYIGNNALSRDSVGDFILRRVLPPLLKRCQLRLINNASQTTEYEVTEFNLMPAG